jgi:uncharacterized protein YjiK
VPVTRTIAGRFKEVADSDLVLFVSHVSEDRVAATEIVEELERRGVRCWIAPRDVRPGRPFDNEIEAALDHCRAMLLIFSEQCNESEYIRREVTVAGEKRKLIIPFRIEDVQPRRGLLVRLADLNWIDGFVSRERAIDELAEKLAASDPENGLDTRRARERQPRIMEASGIRAVAETLQRAPRSFDRKLVIAAGVIVLVVLVAFAALFRGGIFGTQPGQQAAPPQPGPAPAVLASPELTRTLKGHTDQVETVAFSPNGQMLASGSRDKTIDLWEMPSGQLLRTLKGHSETIFSVAFSPDGRTLASGSEDAIRLWDEESGQVLRTLKGSDDAIAVAFSPDGRVLASGDYDKTIKFWDVASGRTVVTGVGHTKNIEAVAFSPDGRTLASGSDDKTIKLWDTASGGLVRTLMDHTDLVEFVAFSPNGQMLASGSDDRTAKLWGWQSGQVLRTLTGHTESVFSVAFSPDGRMLATASHDHTIKLWDTSDGQELRTLRGHSDAVRSVAFSSDGRTLASGSEDKTVKLWDVSNVSKAGR